RHTRSKRDWSSDVCSSDLLTDKEGKEKQYQVLAVGKLPYAAEMQMYSSIEMNMILPEEEFLSLIGDQQPMKTMFNVDKSHIEDKIGRASCRERVGSSVMTG